MSEWIARPEQQEVIEQILNKPRCCLIGELGFGKTGCALSVAKAWIEQGVQSILILASLKLNNLVWKRELQVFGLLDNPAIHRLSFHKLVKDLENDPDKLNAFDAIIFDECLLIKNPKAACSKRLTRALMHSHHRLLFLTGTPINKSYLDIFCAYQILSCGQAFDDMRFEAFKRAYFDENRFGVETRTRTGKWVKHLVSKFDLRPGNDQLIETKILPWVVYGKSLLKKPRLIYRVHAFDFSEKVQGIYHWIKNKQPLQQLSPKGAAIVAGRLTQFTSGCIYNDDKATYTCYHLEKIARLQELIRQLQSDVIVIYKFKHELDLLKRYFPVGRRLTDETYDLWNTNQLPILFLQQQADCMGFNLQKGGCHLIWNSLTFSPSFYQQMIGRIHRVSHHTKVYCHFLIANNTIDWFMLEQLAQEHQQINCFNRNVQKYLKQQG